MTPVMATAGGVDGGGLEPGFEALVEGCERLSRLIDRLDRDLAAVVDRTLDESTGDRRSLDEGLTSWLERVARIEACLCGGRGDIRAQILGPRATSPARPPDPSHRSDGSDPANRRFVNRCSGLAADDAAAIVDAIRHGRSSAGRAAGAGGEPSVADEVRVPVAPPASLHVLHRQIAPLEGPELGDYLSYLVASACRAGPPSVRLAGAEMETSRAMIRITRRVLRHRRRLREALGAEVVREKLCSELIALMNAELERHCRIVERYFDQLGVDPGLLSLWWSRD